MKIFYAVLGVTVAASSLEEEVAMLRAEVKEQHKMTEESSDQQGRVAALQATDYSLGGALDSAWMCLCGALVMFMHAGFGMLETGCCRAKNASNVLMKNLVNVCVGTLGWWIFGWAFAYGEQNGNGFIGTTGFAGFDFYTQDSSTGVITPVASCDSDGCQSTMLSWFFQWAFCTAGATIVSGAVAERVKSPTYAVFAFLMASFIYPVIVAWTWGGGWIATVLDVGYMDFAGSGVVHLTGGVAGLMGTIILGPRKGRFENPEEFEIHNLPLVVLGTFSLWFGWYGFNPGSTLGMHDGATGLVSITAGCGNMECGSAFATGLIGGIVYQGSSMLLQKLKIDDPVDASPVHGFCGIWGVLACGTAIGAQFILVCMVIVWSGILSAIIFALLKLTGTLRVSEEVEDVGMDSHHHSPPKAYAMEAQGPNKNV
eukprot:symbB.v1.2.032390.t1/scaffold3856.1/size95938/8